MKTANELRRLLKERGLSGNTEITKHRGKYHLLHICARTGWPVPLIISPDISEIEEHINLYLLS